MIQILYYHNLHIYIILTFQTTEPMNTNNPIKERLTAFCKAKGISRASFSLSIGRARNYVETIRSSVTPSALDVIRKVYPELNVLWLMTGEGEMFNPIDGITGASGFSISAVGTLNNNGVLGGSGNCATNNTSGANAAELDALKRENETLRREITMRDCIIAEKERLINLLMKLQNGANN